MKRLMVRYRVRADQAAANEQYVKDVFEQLDRRQPSGVRYASFKLDDGVMRHLLTLFENELGAPPMTEEELAAASRRREQDEDEDEE